MAIDEWTGSNTGVWISATNWSSGVPTSSSDVVIASSNDITVLSPTNSVTVNTISVNATDELGIGNGANLFTATDGAPEPIFGVVDVGPGTLVIGNFGNSVAYSNADTGFLVLDSSVAPDQSVLFIEGSVSFIGDGTIQLAEDGIITGDVSRSTLTNVGNTIVSDSGDIKALNFINEASVEAATGGFLTVEGSAEGGSFNNENLLRANEGSTLILGEIGHNATILNSGTVELQNNDSGFTTKLVIAGNVTISSAGNGNILFSGANSDSSSIVSTGGAATLTLVGDSTGNSLSAAGGVIGDTNLTLNLQGFNIIESSATSEFVALAAASTTLDSNSSIVAENSGEIFLEGPISDSGAINAGDGGEIFVGSAITEQPGATAINIGQGGTLSLTSTGRIFGFVAFSGSDATLKVSSANEISESLFGAGATDKIDLTYQAFDPSLQAVWAQGGGAGTLFIEKNGSIQTVVSLAGEYTSGDFALTNDGNGDTLITVLGSLASPSPDDFNRDNISDVFWRNSGGSLAIWLMNGSAVASSGTPTFGGSAVSPDSSWSVAGVGDFNDDGAADVLWRQSSTGSLAMWLMDGFSIEASASPTFNGSAVSPDSSWSVAGVGDFNGDGDVDILWRQSSSGALVDWSMNGSVIQADAYVTYQGNMITPDSSWSVAGIGDFNADGKADMLWRQSTTGALVEWTMKGSTIRSAANVTLAGSVVTPDSTWSVAGVGDFNGDGNADILWRQSTTGTLVDWSMNGSTIASSAFVTAGGNQVTPDSTWNIVEVGNFNGSNQASILWQQSSTGSLVEWQMNGAQIASSSFVTSQGNPIAPPSSWQVQSTPTDLV